MAGRGEKAAGILDWGRSKAHAIYRVRVGPGICSTLILGSVTLFFRPKPPRLKLGMQRGFARIAESMAEAMPFIGRRLLFRVIALLGAGGATGDWLATPFHWQSLGACAANLSAISCGRTPLSLKVG